MEKRVRLHEQQGDKIVLLTSMPELMALPFKHRLKCDDVLSTKLEEKNGAYTGRVTHLNYDKGKIKTMESYTRREGINVAQSYFYADSWTDKSAMELVGHPIAVNPDKKLKRYAKEKGWEILRF